MRKLTWNIFILNFSVHSETVQLGQYIYCRSNNNGHWEGRDSELWGSSACWHSEALSIIGNIRRSYSIVCLVGATAPCFSFQQPILYYLYSQTEIADHIGRHFFPQAIFTIECASDFDMCSGRAVNPRKPERSGVNYSTPELFWGWLEEIPTPEHKFWLLSCIFSPKKLELTTFWSWIWPI